MKALRMVLAMIVLSSLVSGCQWLCQVLCDGSPKPDLQSAVFSGQVVSSIGTPLSEATVTVNSSSITTTDKGFFKLTVSPAPVYIVTIRKRGYGLFSRVYTKGVQKDNWALYRATLTTLNPAIGGVVQDTQTPNCLAARPRSGWEHLEVKGSPVSQNLRTALDLAYKPAGCGAGVSINIPPNALVDADGNNPPPLVEVEVATVDVFSPEAMPGDWGIRFPRDDRLQNNGRQGFMQTLGAGSVSVTAGGKSYQLKSDKKARLTIPIDPTAIQMFKTLKQNPPAKIPLLLYQEKDGTWKPTGVAVLNEPATAYIADLPHFSEWNMDVVFSDVACTQIDSRLIDGGYYLKAVPSVIPAGGLQPHEFDVPNNSSCSSGDPFFCFIQAAWRLPSDPAHGAGQVSFMPGTRAGSTITYNRANFIVPFGVRAPNQLELPPTYVPSGTAGQPGSYPNCTTHVTFADKPNLSLAATPTTLTLTASGYWGPNATIVPSNATDRYELQWCNTATNPCTTDPNYPQNPNAGGWTTFTALPNMSPTGPRPVRSATSSPILRNSLAAGTYQFRVRTHVGHSSFGAGGYDTPWSDATASITIGGNSPPTLAPIGNRTVDVGTSVSFTAIATDPDGDTLTYSLTAAPAGASINSTTGVFTWTPSSGQGATTFTVTVQATDSGALSDTESFTITVNPQVKIENRTGSAPATGCTTPPIDSSMIRLQIQTSDKLVPLSHDTSDGSTYSYPAEGAYIAAGLDSMTFNTTATTYTVIIEMGSWATGGSGGFVQRRYTNHVASPQTCFGLPSYRYLNFTVTQGPGLLTLRVQPSGNQYEVIVVPNGLSTTTLMGKTMTDFALTTPYTLTP